MLFIFEFIVFAEEIKYKNTVCSFMQANSFFVIHVMKNIHVEILTI